MTSKIAIVTGARRGIGLAIATELGRAGYTVVLTGASPVAQSRQAVDTVMATGAQAEYLCCDNADSQARKALIAHVLETYGRLDVLVNNAGIAPRTRADVLETSEESFDEVLSTNLKGTYFMCQLAANAMIQCQQQDLADYQPRIVNISSISAYTASVNRGEYCISKAGIAMVTELFAARLAEYRIPVFEVRPGIIMTDMTAGVREKYQAMIADGLTPIARFGRPEDVADCVMAAVSGRLDFATGQVLNADGGFSIRRL